MRVPLTSTAGSGSCSTPASRVLVEAAVIRRAVLPVLPAVLVRFDVEAHEQRGIPLEREIGKAVAQASLRTPAYPSVVPWDRPKRWRKPFVRFAPSSSA